MSPTHASVLSLLEALDRIRSPRILVFGDLILDRYVEGEANRVSPEAPVLIFEALFSSYRLGGASNVAANVVAAGGSACCLGLVGDDEAADKLQKLMAESGIDTAGVVRDATRRTTLKSRLVSRTHQVLRMDEETVQAPGAAAEAQALAFVERRLGDFDAVVISDYGKGALCDKLLRAVIDPARARGIPVLVDPKGSDYSRYRGATLVTPNRAEAEQASGMKARRDEDLDQVAQRLQQVAALDVVVITLGKDGIYYRTKQGERAVWPTEARAVFDVTGAGDTVVAFLALGLGAKLELGPCIRLANLAAGVVVGRFGTATVTRDELRALLHSASTSKLLDAKMLPQVLVRLRSERRRTVFTNGCFDLLHPGHLDYLTKARSYGDVLVVGINSDASIQRLKGPERPICPLEDRMALLAGLEVVDYVVPFEEDTPQRLIEQVTPAVLVKGEDWRDKGVVGREWVESHGGQVVLVPLKEGYSTSALVERIRRRK